VTPTDRIHLARLTAEGNAAHGAYLDRKRQRAPRVDFTRPDFTVPTAALEG
jgi:hypothetical protein